MPVRLHLEEMLFKVVPDFEFEGLTSGTDCGRALHWGIHQALWSEVLHFNDSQVLRPSYSVVRSRGSSHMT